MVGELPCREQVGADGDTELFGLAELPRGVEGFVRVTPSADCCLVGVQLSGEGGEDADAAGGIPAADPAQLPFQQRDEAGVGLAPFAGSPQLRGSERDGRGKYAILVTDLVGQADRFMECAVRFTDQAARPARVAEFDEHVAADGVGVRQGGRDGGQRLLQLTGRVLPGALPDRPGACLTRILHGFGGVAERPGGQVVVGELGNVGGASRGDVLQRGRDPGVQPCPFHAADARIQALVDEWMPEPEPPVTLGRGDQAGGDRGLKAQQQMLGINAGQVFEQVRLELQARDRGEHEQRLGVVRKSADPAQQDVSDTAGHVVRLHIASGQRLPPVFAADKPDQLPGSTVGVAL
jgi:hypothetical protein